jgi:hypothetical protein
MLRPARHHANRSHVHERALSAFVAAPFTGAIFVVEFMFSDAREKD